MGNTNSDEGKTSCDKLREFAQQLELSKDEKILNIIKKMKSTIQYYIKQNDIKNCTLLLENLKSQVKTHYGEQNAQRKTKKNNLQLLSQQANPQTEKNMLRPQKTMLRTTQKAIDAQIIDDHLQKIITEIANSQSTTSQNNVHPINLFEFIKIEDFIYEAGFVINDLQLINKCKKQKFDNIKEDDYNINLENAFYIIVKYQNDYEFINYVFGTSENEKCNNFRNNLYDCLKLLNIITNMLNNPNFFSNKDEYIYSKSESIICLLDLIISKISTAEIKKSLTSILHNIQRILSPQPPSSSSSSPSSSFSSSQSSSFSSSEPSQPPPPPPPSLQSSSPSSSPSSSQSSQSSTPQSSQSSTPQSS
uniref:Uncharacterized protein n=1 Tax=viral metagenome TaxID=1070528 RepID=A0A6C0HMI4_9ZZZZ